MKKYAMEIAQFAGRRGRTCYEALDCAVEIAVRYLPKEVPIKDICREAAGVCHKEADALYKALSRVPKDIWEYGNRENLETIIGYTLCERPSPKELVFSLAQAFWCREMEKQRTMEYHVLEAGLSDQYGIWGESMTSDECCIVIAPFSASRENVNAMVDQLNREQISAMEFKERILRGDYPDLLG